MMKYILFFIVLTTFTSISHQSVLSESLKRCRRDAASTCVLAPELTEGPYYWNTSLMRQNIAEDRSGIRLRLQVVVTDASTCSPIADAAVTLWHCDAGGIYSHYIQASQNVPNPQNDNQTFLRGIQLTNSNGEATFDTIYPGWYIGRAVHMHIKVHLGGTYLNASSYYSGATYVHTGQLFFNDSFSDLVNAQTPYNNHSGSRMLNSADNIYLSGGSYTLMDVQYVNSGSGFTEGLITTVTLGITSSGNESTTPPPSSTTTTRGMPETATSEINGPNPITTTTSRSQNTTTSSSQTTTTTRRTTTTKPNKHPGGHYPKPNQPGVPSRPGQNHPGQPARPENNHPGRQNRPSGNRH